MNSSSKVSVDDKHIPGKKSSLKEPFLMNMLGIIEQQKATGEYGYILGIDLGEDFTTVAFAGLHSNSLSLDWRIVSQEFPQLYYIRKKNDEVSYILEGWGSSAQIKRDKRLHDSLYLSFSNLFSDENSVVKSKYDDQFLSKRLVKGFLENVINYTKTYIQRYRSDKWAELSELCYCIAVPTTWDDNARVIIREAAIEAGMLKPADEPERLIFISEKVAAIAAMDDTMRYAFNSNIQDNQTIAICDVAYKVVFEGGKRYFEELTRNHDDLVGSSHIDDLARLWIQGHLDHYFEKVDEDAMDTIAQNFNKDDAKYFYIRLPRDIVLKNSNIPDDLKNGFLRITLQHMLKYIFDPVVNRILILIDGQLMTIPRNIPDVVLLTGQFGCSSYLNKRITELFITTNCVGLVCHPRWPETFVSLGALRYGLNPSVIIHRVTRHTYAFQCTKKFRNGIDDPSNLLIRQNGQRRCKNRLDFFVTKNTKIAASYCFEREYNVIYPQKTRSILYSYDGEDDHLPNYVDSKGVQEVFRFNVEMPVTPGKKHGEKIPCKTRIYFGHTEIKTEVLIGGETQVHRVNLLGYPFIFDKYYINVIYWIA
ncbi:hypothetical protein K501DRAFT_266200 [Backusella circina FSU 941]|nr:hypothetical protein K501DRAFT_266200 [Backusella circina FSU 941]